MIRYGSLAILKLQSDIKSRIYYPNHALIGLSDSGDEAFCYGAFLSNARA